MTPETLLQAMCKRHGLSHESARPLLSLVRKALKSPLEARNRILMLVDGNLAERARGRSSTSKLKARRDDELLVTIARTLHDWLPSPGVLGLGRLDVEGESADS